MLLSWPLLLTSMAKPPDYQRLNRRIANQYRDTRNRVLNLLTMFVVSFGVVVMISQVPIVTSFCIVLTLGCLTAWLALLIAHMYSQDDD